MPNILLDAQNIVKHFPIKGGVFLKEIASVKAVDGVSITIDEGETVGLVGESGCGKTTFGRAILRLEEPTSGDIFFEGESILGYDTNKMQALREKMQIIFHDPYSSLTPRRTVGQTLEEPMRVHELYPRDDTRAVAEELLESVGLSPNAIDT